MPVQNDKCKAMFDVSEPFQGVTSVVMNDCMRTMLINLFADIEGGVEPEFWALKRALEDPEGCREARRNRRARPVRSVRYVSEAGFNNQNSNQDDEDGFPDDE